MGDERQGERKEKRTSSGVSTRKRLNPLTETFDSGSE